MRRSTKIALASAFGIALAAAQIGPYVTQRQAEYGKLIEQRRVIRAERLVHKLETVRNDPIPFSVILEWLLVWTDNVIDPAYLSQVRQAPLPNQGNDGSAWSFFGFSGISVTD